MSAESTMNELILEELRALRDDVNAYTRHSGERLATLEAGMYDLKGNGRAGRVERLEASVRALERWRTWIIGIAAGVSGVVSGLGWCVAELWRR